MIPVATLIPHAWRQGNPRLRSPLHRPTEKSAVFKGSESTESTEPIDWRYLPFFKAYGLPLISGWHLRVRHWQLLGLGER